MTRIGADPKPKFLLPLPAHLSYSQLSQLNTQSKYACARKWAYTYRMGLPFISSGALICGSAFDEAANVFFLKRMAGGEFAEALIQAQTTAKEKLLELSSTAIFREPMEQSKVNGYLNALKIGVETFCRLYSQTFVGAIQTRHEFTVRNTDGYRRTVIGYSDRIDADGTIVDHKWSGSARWNKDGEWDMDWVREKKDQLVVYWLSRIAEFTRCIKDGQPWMGPPVEPRGKLVVIHMRSGGKTATLKEFAMEFDVTDRDRVLQVIGDADLRARSGIYPARPGDACGFCSAVEQCRIDSERSDPVFTELTGIPEAL